MEANLIKLFFIRYKSPDKEDDSEDDPEDKSKDDFSSNSAETAEIAPDSLRVGVRGKLGGPNDVPWCSLFSLLSYFRSFGAVSKQKAALASVGNGRGPKTWF